MKTRLLLALCLILSARCATAQYAITDIYNFPGGSYPVGSPVLSGNTLYGVTESGGSNDYGMVYSVKVDGSDFTNLWSFEIPPDGGNPEAGLILSNGVLYGTTTGGGQGVGTIFEIDTNGHNYSVLYSFGEEGDGNYPMAPLTLSGGALYGTTEGGGATGNDIGTVFKFDLGSNTETILHSFDQDANGGTDPEGRLALSDGVLYGTTDADGTNTAIQGVVFSVTTNGDNFTLLHEFVLSNGDGGSLQGGLTLSEGSLYGTAAGGGIYDPFEFSAKGGTVFAVATNAVATNDNYSGFTNLISFGGVGGADGANPTGDLVLSNGGFFGTTLGHNGGSINSTVFFINTDGSGYTTLVGGAGDPPAPPGAGDANGLVLSGTNLYVNAIGDGNGAGVLYGVDVSAPTPPCTNSPTIQTQPSLPPVNGTFAVSASGAYLSYQWYLNGSPIPNAYSYYYDTFGGTGDYYVIVSNACGTTQSDPVDYTCNFSEVGNLNTARRFESAFLLTNGLVLAAGGYGPTTYLKSAELYDPSTGEWTNTESMAVARIYQAGVMLPDGLVLIAGGQSSSPLTTSTAEIYNTETGSWSYTGSLNVAREYHTLTLMTNGLVLAAAGADENGTPTELYSAEVYDPATGDWTNTGSLSVACQNHTATVLPSGLVLVAGGLNYGTALTNAEVYNPATGMWTNTGPLNIARGAHTATLLPSGLVLVAGGQDSSGNGLYSAELYDPETGTWTTTGSMNAPRYSHTATLLPNGLVLVSGGQINFTQATNDAELYNPSTGKWLSTCTLNAARWGQAAILLPDETVLTPGGYSGSASLYSSELYNP